MKGMISKVSLLPPLNDRPERWAPSAVPGPAWPRLTGGLGPDPEW